MTFRLPLLELQIALSGDDILLVGAVHVLVIIVVASSDYHPSGAPLLPLLPPLAPFLGPFPVSLDGSTNSLPVTIFLSPRRKTTSTTSSQRRTGWRYQVAPWWCFAGRDRVHTLMSHRSCRTGMLRWHWRHLPSGARGTSGRSTECCRGPVPRYRGPPVTTQKIWIQPSSLEQQTTGNHAPHTRYHPITPG
jgi:hypothetical protein